MRKRGDGRYDVTTPRAGHAWLRLMTTPTSPLLRSLADKKIAPAEVRIVQAPQVVDQTVTAILQVRGPQDPKERAAEQAKHRVLITSPVVLSAAVAELGERFEERRLQAKAVQQAREALSVQFLSESELMQLVFRLKKEPNAEHVKLLAAVIKACLLYTSPSPRDGLLSRMPSSA